MKCTSENRYQKIILSIILLFLLQCNISICNPVPVAVKVMGQRGHGILNFLVRLKGTDNTTINRENFETFAVNENYTIRQIKIAKKYGGICYGIFGQSFLEPKPIEEERTIRVTDRSELNKLVQHINQSHDLTVDGSVYDLQ